MNLRYIFLFFVTSFITVSCFENATPDERAAMELAGRIVPSYTSDLVFKEVENDTDFFELASEEGKIIISGNNANSMAMGLNYYLKNYCDVTVSWYAFEPVQYPDQMPSVEEIVRVEARTGNRFFLN